MATLNLQGKYAWDCYKIFLKCTIQTTWRRLRRGPMFPNWPWSMEVGFDILKAQNLDSHRLPQITEQRAFMDGLVFDLPALNQVLIEEINTGGVRGRWFTPRKDVSGITVLYLHGGGYAFYARAHNNLIALTALASRARTFALDYRLIPEHPYPAQLEDALEAYRMLLTAGISPKHLVVAGDSAGGNLVMALLLSLKKKNLPLPALAVLLCPWTDVNNSGDSMFLNASTDWVTAEQANEWARWFVGENDPKDPLISPIYADLQGLPPIYIQAGDKEILYDMICEFSRRAQAQGASVTLDIFANMPHDFQSFGPDLPAARDALQRIGIQVSRHTGR